MSAPMDAVEFTARMKELAAMGDADPEASHGEADGLMCGLLRQLGYGEGVDVYHSMTKWYA